MDHMSLNKNFFIGLIAGVMVTSGVGALTSRESHAPSKNEARGIHPSAEFSKLPDTAENRSRAAQLVLDAYPTEQFATAVAARVEKVVGKEVTGDARWRFASRTAEEEFLIQRSKILAQVFTPAELATFASLLETPSGRTLIEKLPEHDELWRQYLSPILSEIMSGQR